LVAFIVAKGFKNTSRFEKNFFEVRAILLKDKWLIFEAFHDCSIVRVEKIQLGGRFNVFREILFPESFPPVRWQSGELLWTLALLL
jgi:hypothetical protein